MPIPEFIVELRKKIGHDPLWLVGCTAVVVRAHADDAARRADAEAACETVGTASDPNAPRVGLGAVDASVWQAGDGSEDVLLVRRADDGLWAPVTGVVDPGEHPAIAAVRETFEEARVEAEIERLAQVHVTDEVTHANGDRAQYTGLVFRCRAIGGSVGVGDDESIDARWWPSDAMPPMRQVHRDAIAAALRREALAELRVGDSVLPVVAP
ncbi:NUDIX hydrolase [Gulosibacter bifidus]|uniref:NUDIX domain-containing protein n=1 Tax=Gulosibacter bifidus TaxID=272239 RepID=A0ABW5RJC9_9MICO|nr:NUDIX domain-containing protein [Gulosibacter bifidus]